VTGRQFSALLASAFLAFLAQFLIGLAGVTAALLGAAAAGLVAWLAMRAFWSAGHGWAVASAAVACLAAVGLLFVIDGFEPILLFCPVIAAVPPAIALLAVRPVRGVVCALCRTRANIAFECPRCSQTVCDKTECWDFHHRRCHLCEEKGVRLLPEDTIWWQRNFAPAPMGAKCRLCLEETGLYACLKCGGVACRDCWDGENGQCGRCGWYSPEVPASVQKYLSSEKY